jgi:hypothetical protein
MLDEGASVPFAEGRYVLRILAPALMLSLLCSLSASTVDAAALWTVEARTSDGSPLEAVTPGAQLVLDITLRTVDSTAAGLAGSVNTYDPAVVAPNVAETVVASEVLVASATGPGSGLGGLSNIRGDTLPLQEEAISGVGVEFEFFSGTTIELTAEDGTLDQGVLTGAVGDPQFRVVMDVIGMPGDETTLRIGTFAEYGDLYTGVFPDPPGGIDNEVINTAVSIRIVPQPGTALLTGLGLVGMALLKGGS